MHDQVLLAKGGQEVGVYLQKKAPSPSALQHKISAAISIASAAAVPISRKRRKMPYSSSASSAKTPKSTHSQEIPSKISAMKAGNFVGRAISSSF